MIKPTAQIQNSLSPIILNNAVTLYYNIILKF
jgi:hypothetical protein